MPRHVSGPATILFRRRDDGWKMILFHSIPLPEGRGTQPSRRARGLRQGRRRSLSGAWFSELFHEPRNDFCDLVVCEWVSSLDRCEHRSLAEGPIENRSPRGDAIRWALSCSGSLQMPLAVAVESSPSLRGDQRRVPAALCPRAATRSRSARPAWRASRRCSSDAHGRRR